MTQVRWYPALQQILGFKQHFQTSKKNSGSKCKKAEHPTIQEKGHDNLCRLIEDIIQSCSHIRMFQDLATQEKHQTHSVRKISSDSFQPKPIFHTEKNYEAWPVAGFPVPSQEDGYLRNPKFQAVSSFTVKNNSNSFPKSRSNQLHQDKMTAPKKCSQWKTTVQQKDDMGSLEDKLRRAMVSFLGMCLKT